MQNVDLRNKNYKQVLVRNESGAARKKIIFDFFFHLNFFFISILFGLVLQVSEHSMS